MKVVADSSPLIVLASIGYFDQIAKIYDRVYITNEVHAEIVVAGAGLPGAAQVAAADWIEVKNLEHPGSLAASKSTYHLGTGELSTLMLGKEIGADLVIVDDLKARKLAMEFGFPVRGTVGLLEGLYRRGHVGDLRSLFSGLLASGAYIDRTLLNLRLEAHGLPPL